MAKPQDFLDSIRRTGGPAIPAKFEVEIPSKELERNELKFRCSQAVLPGMTAATSQYGTGMPEKNNPYRPTFEDVTLGFYCTDGIGKEGLPERQFFDEWQQSIFINSDPDFIVKSRLNRSTTPRNWTWKVAYREDYTRNIKITKLSQAGVANVEYILHNAFPVTISDTELNWESEEILQMEIVFSYDWWTKSTPIT